MVIDKIYQGDCFKLFEQLEGGSIDTVFTSPPYNRIRNDTYKYYDDNRQDYLELLTKTAEQSLRVARNNVIINIQSNHYNKNDVYKFIGLFAEKISGMVVWGKTNPTPSVNFDGETCSITNAYELFIVMTHDGQRFRSYGETPIKNWIISSVNSEHFEGHGAVMKLEIAQHFIQKFTREGDVVLDCFSGCGTTAVACQSLGRHYIGFEIVQKYIDISENRLEKSVQQALEI